MKRDGACRTSPGRSRWGGVLAGLEHAPGHRAGHAGFDGVELGQRAVLVIGALYQQQGHVDGGEIFADVQRCEGLVQPHVAPAAERCVHLRAVAQFQALAQRPVAVRAVGCADSGQTVVGLCGLDTGNRHTDRGTGNWEHEGARVTCVEYQHRRRAHRRGLEVRFR
ncbi:MAG: hypothetical protein ACR2RL_24690 [Gammaproteobacteria bacterium]